LNSEGVTVAEGEVCPAIMMGLPLEVDCRSFPMSLYRAVSASPHAHNGSPSSPPSERVRFICVCAGIPPPARKPAVKRGSRYGLHLYLGDRASPVRGTDFAHQPGLLRWVAEANGIPLADGVGWSSHLIREAVLGLPGRCEQTRTTSGHSHRRTS